MHAYPGRLFFQLFVERHFAPTTIEDQVSLLSRHGLIIDSEKELARWLKSLVTVRNLCAHHARVMNRTFVHAPRYAHTVRNQPWHGRWPDARRVYTMLTIIGVIVETIPGGEEWKQQTIGLLRTRSRATPDKMGVPDDWETEPLWNRP